MERKRWVKGARCEHSSNGETIQSCVNCGRLIEWNIKTKKWVLWKPKKKEKNELS
jgi:Zn ribbon nucleic-acid-binding protein